MEYFFHISSQLKFISFYIVVICMHASLIENKHLQRNDCVPMIWYPCSLCLAQKRCSLNIITGWEREKLVKAHQLLCILEDHSAGIHSLLLYQCTLVASNYFGREEDLLNSFIPLPYAYWVRQWTQYPAEYKQECHKYLSSRTSKPPKWNEKIQYNEWQRNKIFFSVSEGGKVLLSGGMKDKGDLKKWCLSWTLKDGWDARSKVKQRVRYGNNGFCMIMQVWKWEAQVGKVMLRDRGYKPRQ